MNKEESTVDEFGENSVEDNTKSDEIRLLVERVKNIKYIKTKSL